MLNHLAAIDRAINWLFGSCKSTLAKMRAAHNDVHETFFSGVEHRNPMNADAEHDDPVTIAPWQTKAEERIAKIVERRRTKGRGIP